MRRLRPEITHSARKCCTCASHAVPERTMFVHARAPHIEPAGISAHPNTAGGRRRNPGRGVQDTNLGAFML
eukprot:4232041-Alexandrium_andersonii.AAC.1